MSPHFWQVPLKLTPDSLTGQLEQRLLPAYLVSGDEPLLAGEAADAIRARARAMGFTEREVHFLERGSDWDDVRASAGNMSLFGSRRLFELRLPTGRPGVAGNKALLDLLERNDPDTLLLILAPRLDRDVQAAPWFRALESRGGWVAVWPVEPERLVGWLRGRCRRLQLEVTDEALALLAERTEGNLLAAHQELEKLRLLAPAGAITADTVLASVADSARFDVFRLSEAVLEGEADRALRVLAGLRSEGTEQTLVLWALTKALRDVWGAVSSPGGAGGRGRGGWQRQTAALDRAVRRAPRLSFRALTLRAARADRMIKGRLQGDAWDEMALLAADICGRPAMTPPQSMFK
ncbi:MAG TPA: DNA polymerase III subunit delta [Steroidobacteraceae bacterium]|nr:DNA polymerase III subunit delta [Steroidobacteraceae bacterium]